MLQVNDISTYYGQIRALDLVTLTVKPGEIVTDLLLPAPRPGTRSTYRKVRSRGSWDFALAGAAVAVQLEAGKVAKARIVLSGAAPVPWRTKRAEEALIGEVLDSGTIRSVAAAAVAGAQPMSGNAYKIELVKGVVEEALLAIA